MGGPPQSSLLLGRDFFVVQELPQSMLAWGRDVKGDVKFRDALYRYSTKRIAEETEA
jgi:hypothetical protein